MPTAKEKLFSSLFHKVPEKPEETIPPSSITLTGPQAGVLLEIFAQRFLPPDSLSQTTIFNASKKILSTFQVE